jgi:hypothetical protein
MLIDDIINFSSNEDRYVYLFLYKSDSDKKLLNFLTELISNRTSKKIVYNLEESCDDTILVLDYSKFNKEIKRGIIDNYANIIFTKIEGIVDDGTRYSSSIFLTVSDGTIFLHKFRGLKHSDYISGFNLLQYIRSIKLNILIDLPS